MSTKRPCQTPREALEKLKINPGGKGSVEAVCEGLMVSLTEAPRDADTPYQISVLFGPRRKAIGLSADEVITKGKSPWRRDNRWRLRQETIDRFEPQIADLVAEIKTRTRRDNQLLAKGMTEEEEKKSS